MGHLKEVHPPSSGSRLYSGKPLYFWRDQFEMLNSKIGMKQKDIRLLKSAIDKTDMDSSDRAAQGIGGGASGVEGKGQIGRRPPMGLGGLTSC